MKWIDPEKKRSTQKSDRNSKINEEEPLETTEARDAVKAQVAKTKDRLK